MNMDLETGKPVYEPSVKLIAAVRKYKCLHDQIAHTKNAPIKCEEAWEAVAEECNESIECCKSRWKNLRRSFYERLKRKGQKYYLHDQLDFLLKADLKKAKRNAQATQNNATNSANSEKTAENNNNTSLRAGEAVKPFKTLGEEDEIKSFDSQTTSADESNEVLPPSSGVFIINEFGDDSTNYTPSVDLEEERRHSFNRSCKRALDQNLIDELVSEEPELKRSRKTDKPINKSIPKIKISAKKDTVENGTLSDSCASTTTTKKIFQDAATQYEFSSTDFDDVFMQSIKNQLQEMNGRQKLHFKRKIYESLMEVFDDGNDFPNSNKTLNVTNKQTPNVVNTTTGELRLIRELVSLVQAAKNSPEIMNAKEKLKTNTPVASKPDAKTPATINENRIKEKSPLAMSPTPDDDDLQFFIDDTDDEEEFPLPRSWDEIKAKTADTAKGIAENNLGLTRRILQKVVKVSGSNRGTIVTRDGDKKRIYRIVPKQTNNTSTINATTNKTDSNVSRIFVSGTKNVQDPRKEGGVGTFYVSNKKPNQDVTKFSNSANITIRPVGSKSLNNVTQFNNATVNNNNNQSPTTFNNNHNTTGQQTINKNVQPGNRILSSSTGFFKMVSQPTKIGSMASPSQKQPISQSLSPTSTNTPTISKVMTAKLPMNPSMLPPSSNTVTKKQHTIRQAPQMMQRRFSICGSTSAEKQNSPAPTSNTSSAHNTNAQAQSSISRIQISQAVSLNAKAVNSPTATINQNPTNHKITDANHPHQQTAKPLDTHTSKEAKHLVKSQETPKEANQQLAETATNAVLETTRVQREIPVLETAGTVAADDLDPLFVKNAFVKSEPIDVDDE